MKKLISILLAVLLIAAMSGTAFAETGIGVEPGQAMPDFTVSLTDGTTATLSELLKERIWSYSISLPAGAVPVNGNSPRWKPSIRQTVTVW